MRRLEGLLHGFLFGLEFLLFKIWVSGFTPMHTSFPPLFFQVRFLVLGTVRAAPRRDREP